MFPIESMSFSQGQLRFWRLPSRGAPPSFLLRFLLLGVGGMLSAGSLAGELPTWSLLASAQTDGSGIYLDQIIKPAPPAVLPHLRLAAPPLLGQTLTLRRSQIIQLLQKTPGLPPANWTGPNQISLTRRTRPLHEPELVKLLQNSLQKEWKENGRVEVRLNRPWTPILIPDEALHARIFDLPNNGLTSSLLIQFDLTTDQERIGTWQLAAQVALYREVLVARAPLRRGQLLREAELTTEQRDVLSLRQPLGPEALDNPGLELTENILAGAPVLARSARLRPLVRRGNVVDAILQDGALQISLKVQVLEDGLPGQLVRVRNLKSKHEFLGRVQNENTISVVL